MGELSNQRQAEALELILLDELIEVHAQQLECHADVVAEGEILQHVDDVHGVVLVLLPQVLQDSDLLCRLPVEALLVSHHLQGHVLVDFVVIGLDHLPKAPLPDDLEDLVPVSHVIVRHLHVGSLVVIVATVVGPTCHALALLCVWTQEIDFRIAENLMVFKGGQFLHVLLHCLFRCHRGGFHLPDALHRLQRGGAPLPPMDALQLPLGHHRQSRFAHRCETIWLCCEHCPLVAVILKQLLNLDLPVAVAANMEVIIHCVLTAADLEFRKET